MPAAKWPEAQSVQPWDTAAVALVVAWSHLLDIALTFAASIVPVITPGALIVVQAVAASSEAPVPLDNLLHRPSAATLSSCWQPAGPGGHCAPVSAP